MIPVYVGETKPIGKLIKVDEKNSAQNLAPWEIKDAKYFIYTEDGIQIEYGDCILNNEEKLIYHWFTAKKSGLYKVSYIVNIEPNVCKFTNYICVKE